MTHNAALGQRDGVPKEKFAALADYTTNPLFSDLERLVIRYAEEMTEKVQVDSRLVESSSSSGDPKPSCSSRSASRPPTSRTASTRRSARSWKLSNEAFYESHVRGGPDQTS